MAGSDKEKSGSFLVQGSILAVAGLIVRVIGLIYRIPLTNIIGDAGMGVYSTAYSIYNILLLISSYTLPIAVSRLIAERLAKHKYNESRKLFICSLMFALFSGTVFGSLCFFGADAFAAFMEMPQAAFAIKTLAPTIFIMAFLGVLRGYFQGHGTMVPTAVSQIFEQIVNAAVSIIAGIVLFKTGTDLDLAAAAGKTADDFFSSSYGAAGGTIGTGAGAATALIVCLFLYFIQRKAALKRCMRHPEEKTQDSIILMKILLMTIFPVLISATIYQISTIIDQAIFAKYIGTDYKSIWGAFNGKYLLLVHVPTAIAMSVGSATIPSLAAAASRGNKEEINLKTGMAVRFNMLIAIPATVGLAVLAKPIMDLLFNTDNTAAAYMMLAGSTAILFTALSTITNSVLQGIGNIWIPVRNSAIALVTHVAVLIILLWGLDMGIYGVVVANIVFYIIMCLLNNLSLGSKIDYVQEWKKTFIYPLISSAVMGLSAWLIYYALNKISGHSSISVIIAIIAAVIVYFIVLLLSGGLDYNDIKDVRGGKKIAGILTKLHLLRH